jgi:hypothetical protein
MSSDNVEYTILNSGCPVGAIPCFSSKTAIDFASSDEVANRPKKEILRKNPRIEEFLDEDGKLPPNHFFAI